MVLSEEGKVLTYTVIRVAPDGYGDQAPYAMAVVELDGGGRLMSQVVDCDPSIVLPGLEVELEFRLIRKEGKSGILCYGHKGVPVP